MRKLIFTGLAFILAIIVFQACNEPLTEEPSSADLSLKSASSVKSYIVVLNDFELNSELSNLKGYEKKQALVKSASAKILKRAGITDGQIGHVYGSAITGFSVMIPPGQLKKLQDDPSVKYIEEDQIITLVEPQVKPSKGKPGGGGGGTTPPAQKIPWGIPRVNGGGSNYTGDNIAWIIDSGIDLDHPDLNVDESLSKSFIVSGKRTTPDDEHGHGTHVAGTVAAINNSYGVVGVAPGAKVVALRVLDRTGSGSFSWTIAALDYVATEQIGSPGDVVNMSLGPKSRYTDTAVDEAVTAVAAKGIKIAIAAGNESDDATYYSPARVNHKNVYTVSAMDLNDNFAYFSNYGSPVDYCEPGVGILSCYKGGTYATMSGTSMASPHMAGLLLLGAINTVDDVNGDPDENADPIGVH